MVPKVSIATATFNRPGMLRRAIESLRAQTDQNWEHLIFDDCSTDPAMLEVLAWAAKDSRVRIWVGEQNIDKPAVRWNFLLDRARGRYFSTLDDDNEKLPLFIEAMAKELDQDSSLGLVTCGFIVRTEGQSDWEHHHNLRTVPEVVKDTSTCEGGSMLYRRESFELVGHFSESIRTNEDWEWVRRAVRVLKVKNLPSCHTIYHQHNTNRQLRAEDLGHMADVAFLKKSWPGGK
jgi:glycosyltransferase involved in cell wall biosynthesis